MAFDQSRADEARRIQGLSVMVSVTNWLERTPSSAAESSLSSSCPLAIVS
jgi:hypothetical protein